VVQALKDLILSENNTAYLDREMIANLPALLPELAFKAYIRKNIDVKKAPIALLPLRQYSPRCSAAQDYAALADEMLARMGG
jgi:cellulose biosynthesis protein BcsQ